MYCLILLASLIFLPSFLSSLLWPCFLHPWWQIISTDWHLTKSCFLIGLKASRFITGLNYIEKSCWWCSQKMRNSAVMWRSRVLQREGDFPSEWVDDLISFLGWTVLTVTACSCHSVPVCQSSFPGLVPVRYNRSLLKRFIYVKTNSRDMISLYFYIHKSSQCYSFKQLLFIKFLQIK